MWKTLGGFTAQISRFQNILPLSTAQINCSGSDLSFFRKPYVVDTGQLREQNQLCRTHYSRIYKLGQE
jgi:hypothetical protein